MKKFVALSVSSIVGTRYADVLTYPRVDLRLQAERVKELQQLDVDDLLFCDESCSSNFGLLGKGCVGVVVVGHWRRKRVAVKIRRVDADRAMMQREAKLLERANGVGVGPRLYAVSNNFLVMQLIDGHPLPEWLVGMSNMALVKRVLHDVMEQCWRLDQAGLDHGELSHAPKHIIVHKGIRPFIVDFETASVDRKPANVTSVCQFLFVSDLVRRNFENAFGVNRQRIIAALKRYKHLRTREDFERVLSACRLQTT